MRNTFITVLRWIGVLPAALLAGFIFTYLIRHAAEYSEDYGVISDWYNKAIVHGIICAQAFFYPLIFAGAGLYMAPKYQVTIGCTLTVLAFIVGLVTTYAFIRFNVHLELKNYLFIIFHILGSLVSFFLIREFRRN